MIKLPKGTRQVSTLAFSKDSNYLAVCDVHNDHNVYVYNLQVDTKDETIKGTLVPGYP
jgi:hypothetical protein